MQFILDLSIVYCIMGIVVYMINLNNIIRFIDRMPVGLVSDVALLLLIFGLAFAWPYFVYRRIKIGLCSFLSSLEP